MSKRALTLSDLFGNSRAKRLGQAALAVLLPLLLLATTLSLIPARAAGDPL